VSADGNNPVRLSEHVLNGNDEHSTPSTWSPDGRLIAFTQTGCSWPQGAWNCALPPHIEVLRLSDRQVTQLTEGSSPSWRP